MFESKFFIVAPSFHGATLLSRLLHAHPRVISLGDTYPSNKIDQICGCGNRVSACAFWQDIKQRIEAARFVPSPNMLPLYPTAWGPTIDSLIVKHVSMRKINGIFPGGRLNLFVEDYRRFLDAVYGQFSDQQPCVFVDGVKSVPRIKALLAGGEKIGGILHLVRDPGDFAYSLMKTEGRSVANFVRAGLWWHREHRRCARLKRHAPYLRIGYEAMCRDPDAVLAEVFRFLGVPPMSVGELRQHSKEPWHFMGSASLFKFDWTIKWRPYELSGLERLVISRLAGSSGFEAA